MSNPLFVYLVEHDALGYTHPTNGRPCAFPAADLVQFWNVTGRGLQRTLPRVGETPRIATMADFTPSDFAALRSARKQR